ncbi:MAG: cytochrome c maturation protein CcmE [Rhodothermales bacterium]
MKPKTIIGLVLMVGFASILFLNFGKQVGGYMNFEEAAQTGAKAHVSGHWVKEQATNYDPAQNLFSFYMRDNQGVVRQVQYSNPRPASFEDAEKLVVEGYVKGDIFIADNILMKCPSKYNDERGLQQANQPGT